MYIYVYASVSAPLIDANKWSYVELRAGPSTCTRGANSILIRESKPQ